MNVCIIAESFASEEKQQMARPTALLEKIDLRMVREDAIEAFLPGPYAKIMRFLWDEVRPVNVTRIMNHMGLRRETVWSYLDTLYKMNLVYRKSMGSGIPGLWGANISEMEFREVVANRLREAANSIE